MYPVEMYVQVGLWHRVPLGANTARVSTIEVLIRRLVGSVSTGLGYL